jgi:hypothetical protein
MIVEWMVNIWIVLMLLTMIGWDQRPESPIKWLIRPLVPVIGWAGLWHCWNMFAPNVDRVTLRAEVVVQFANGQSATWNPPGWISMTPWTAFCRLRWRKTFESSLGTENRDLRASICRFGFDEVLATLRDGQSAVPVEIQLIQISEPIMAFDEFGPPRPAKRSVVHRVLVEPAKKAAVG